MSDHWNSVYKKTGTEKPLYDNWLDKYLPDFQLGKDVPVIDLGCGFGNDTLYLTEKGFKVISCDFSDEALNRLNNFIENPCTKCFDMRNNFPFNNSSAKIVISDLSIHYFSTDDTKKIINEISRILVPGGKLLCRVNSINDVNYGAGQGTVIEKNFYEYKGSLKRFFAEEDINCFFKDWQIDNLAETQMMRYEKLKIVWEFSAVKL